MAILNELSLHDGSNDVYSHGVLTREEIKHFLSDRYSIICLNDGASNLDFDHDLRPMVDRSLRVGQTHRRVS